MTSRIDHIAIDDFRIAYRWTGVVRGFDMPIDVTLPGGTVRTLEPREAWQTVALPSAAAGTEELHVDPDYYVEARRAPRQSLKQPFASPARQMVHTPRATAGTRCSHHSG